MFKNRQHDDPKLEVLRSVDMFRGCSDAELRRLAAAWEHVELPAGRVLVEQGTRGSEAFVVASGTARVEVDGQAIADIGPGAVVGEMALLDHGPRAATVTLTSDAELLVIDVQRFSTLLDELPAVARKILVTLSQRLREVEGALTT